MHGPPASLLLLLPLALLAVPPAAADPEAAPSTWPSCTPVYVDPFHPPPVMVYHHCLFPLPVPPALSTCPLITLRPERPPFIVIEPACLG